MPEKEKVNNYVALYGSLILAVTILVMFLSNLLCQIHSSSFKKTLAFIILNLTVMIISNILVYRQGDESYLEIMWYVGVIFAVVINKIIHALIIKQNSEARVQQSVILFEFEQYKDMFNSLQEGVIVLDQPTAEEPKHRVFFINEIMQTILNMLLPGDDQVDLQEHFDFPIFNIYRAEN